MKKTSPPKFSVGEVVVVLPFDYKGRVLGIDMESFSYYHYFIALLPDKTWKIGDEKYWLEEKYLAKAGEEFQTENFRNFFRKEA